jgi:valyl-tRNA synthetase
MPELAALDTGSLVVVDPESVAALSATDADAQRERARLEAELQEARRQMAAIEGRLADGAFTSRAPAHVVDGARARQAELRELVARLEGRLG